MAITTGTRLYYTGDMANSSDFGTVTAITSDKWGTFATIKLDDGRDRPRIPLSMIGEKYEGHCGTRFVTLAAYEAHRAARIAEFSARYGVRVS